MTPEEASRRAERYRRVAEYAFLLDGKLYLLLTRYGADIYLTHVLREDGTPETHLTGSLNHLRLVTPTELQDQGATLLYGTESSLFPRSSQEKGIPL